MAKNNGKRFEECFKESCEKQGILHVNFDDSNKFGFGTNTRFTPNSICDCLIFNGSYVVLIEQRNMSGSSISFNNPPDENNQKTQPMIKSHQVKSLLEHASYKNVFCGLLLNFEDRETKKTYVLGGTYYIPIKTFYDWACTCGKKSINLEDAKLLGVEVSRKLKRVNYTYDAIKMFNDIKDMGVEYE